MDLTDALRVLGLGPDATWTEIRHTYRVRLRQAHPDTAGHGASPADVARLHEAHRLLAAATARGQRPLPGAVARAARPSPPATPPTVEPAVELILPDGEPFLALLDAAHRLGEVAYADRDEGLLQVLLETPTGDRCQLMVSIDERVDPPRVAFTLDALGPRPAPPIGQVVRLLASFIGP